MTAALIAVAALIAILNIAVSRSVLRSSKYDRRQIWAQLALIWFVPVLGSLVAHSFLREGDAERFTTDLSDRLGSGDFDRAGHTSHDYGGGDSGGAGGDGK